VIDVKDMKLSQVTSDFLTLVKLLAQIDQQQYPETLGKFFIINTPSVFPFVWRMVKVKIKIKCISYIINSCEIKRDFQKFIST
jgi:hypothetical protein